MSSPRFPLRSRNRVLLPCLEFHRKHHEESVTSVRWTQRHWFDVYWFILCSSSVHSWFIPHYHHHQFIINSSSIHCSLSFVMIQHHSSLFTLFIIIDVIHHIMICSHLALFSFIFGSMHPYFESNPLSFTTPDSFILRSLSFRVWESSRPLKRLMLMGKLTGFLCGADSVMAIY